MSSSSKRLAILFPLFLVIYEIAVYLSNDMYLPALPEMQDSFATTEEMVQFTLIAWLFGSASFQLFLGPISDRYGRRPVLLLGGLVFVIASFVCAITDNITIMLIGRFFQGTAVCSIFVSGYSAVHEYLPESEAIQTIATMNSVTILAPALGPLAGSIVLMFGDWPLIFYALATLGLVSVTALYKYMPETKLDGKDMHPIEVGKIFSNYFKITTNFYFMIYTLVVSLLFTGMISWLVVGPFLVITEFAQSTTMFGIYQIFIFGGFIIGTRLIKFMLQRMVAQLLINIGLILSLVGGGIAFILSLILPQNLWGLILPLSIFGFGVGLVYAPLQRLAVQTSPEPMGVKLAVYSCSLGITSAIGSAIVGFLYSGPLVTFSGSIVALSVIGCVFKFLIPKFFENKKPAFQSLKQE